MNHWKIEGDFKTLTNKKYDKSDLIYHNKHSFNKYKNIKIFDFKLSFN